MTTSPASGNRPDPCALSDIAPPERYGRKSAPAALPGASGATSIGRLWPPAAVRSGAAVHDLGFDEDAPCLLPTGRARPGRSVRREMRSLTCSPERDVHRATSTTEHGRYTAPH